MGLKSIEEQHLAYKMMLSPIFYISNIIIVRFLFCDLFWIIPARKESMLNETKQPLPKRIDFHFSNLKLFN